MNTSGEGKAGNRKEAGKMRDRNVGRQKGQFMRLAYPEWQQQVDKVSWNK
ncbi:MAG TPA: hypothetical protein GXZ24_05870 [Firmicutes bacterium]|nr:hypothetical protein [Bacillota bacterium]